MRKRIIITGGHLTPALAVIDELVKQNKWEIFFLGRKYASEREKTPSVESPIISERGIRFCPLTAGRFPRHWNRYDFLSTLKIPFGFFQALYYLLHLRPRVILSFGGYLSVPVVFWAWLLGIPSLTHEQTTVTGLATKVNTIFARKIAVSWPKSIGQFPKNKVVLTGNPLRKETFQINNDIWKILNFSEKLPTVFITGGNQGSHIINQSMLSILPKLVSLGNIFHQCGHLEAMGDFEQLEAARAKLPKNYQNRYHVKKYLTGEEMGTLLNKANLIVSRAGANTLTEIAALGKVVLFIPRPWIYQDEQTHNAQMLTEAGTAEILFQENLSAQALIEKIEMMLKNLNKYERNASVAKKLVKLDAAERITREVEKMA